MIINNSVRIQTMCCQIFIAVKLYPKLKIYFVPESN